MRFYRFKRKYKLIILFIIYIASISLISVGYSILKTDLGLQTSVSLVKSSNEYDFILTNNSSWGDVGNYYYHYSFDITYKGNDDVIGWKVLVEVPNDGVIGGCYGGIDCDINNSILSITNPPYGGNISSGGTFNVGFQIATSVSNYVPKLDSIIFIKNNVGDLANNPFQGFLVGEYDLVSTSDSLVFNFNDGSTGGWYLTDGENNGYLINFNNGKSLGMKKNFNDYVNNVKQNIIYLKNDNIENMPNFNDYKVLSYRIYLPRESNVSGIKYNSYISNSNGIDKIFDNDNLDGVSSSKFRITSDNGYYVIDREMNRIDNNNKEGIFTDMIEILGEYSGYYIVDSIRLSDKKYPSIDSISGFNLSINGGSSWNDVIQYDIVFKNNSDVSLKSWRIEIILPSNSTLTNLWGCNYVLNDEMLILSPPTWASDFIPSSEISIGFQLEYLDSKAIKINSVRGVTTDLKDVVIRYE